MKIEKNRFVIPLNGSCDYCDNEWGLLEDEDWKNVYYDPTDDSVICNVCHKTYGSAGSKEGAE